MSAYVENQNLTQSIPKLYLHSDYADVYFEFKSNAETVRVPAHKYILAITSPVFAAMFFGPLKENDVVEIVDANESAFKEFLQLFYRVDVELTIENIETVVRLADKYDIMGCLNACATLLENDLHDDETIWAYQLAISLNHENLKQFCENEIHKSTTNILKSDAFLRCDRNILENILKMEKLNCDEIDVFNGCIEWAKSSCRRNGLDDNRAENLRNELSECFFLIQFSEMTIEQIGAILSNDIHEGLFSRNELSEVMRMKSVESYNSEIFKHIPRLNRMAVWRSDNILECTRLRAEGEWVDMGSQESTWFTTNKPLKLGGKITCGSVYRDGDTFVDTNAVISIIEYNSQTISLDAEYKVLFTDSIKFYGDEPVKSCVTLSQPILLQSDKMYEIRLQFAANFNDYLNQSEWETQVKLDDETIINFHTNPSEHDSDRRGLVHSLQFNRI